MKITLTAKKGVVQCQLTGPILDQLREVPGRSKWVDRDLHFENTAANVEFLRRAFPNAVWDDQVGRLSQLDADAARLAQGVAIKRMELPPEASAFPFKTKPRDHQLRAFQWAKGRPYFALFMEMGTGKTKTLIDIVSERWASGEIETFILFAPNGVHEQWLEPGNKQVPTDPTKIGEIPKHMSEMVEWIGHVYKSGKPVPKEMFERTHKLRVLCVNIEAMSHASGVKVVEQFLNTGKCFIGVDESTVIKTPGAARSKAIRKMGKQAVARAILCGAPITRSIEDIFGQFLFLHEDALGFSSFYTFRNRYCDVVPAYPGAPHGVVRVTGHKNMEEFTKKIDSHSFRVTKDECLDLPPKIYLERSVEMTPDQKRLYKEIAEECYAQLDGRIIDVNSAVGKILRLQQVLCGHLPGEVEGEYTAIPSNRVNALLQWLEDCGNKVVIWARFIPDIDMICKALGNKHTFVRYDGQVSQALRTANRDRWLSDPDCRIIVANPAAAARGQNWQIAQDVGYFSNSFDADHRWQSEDRTHRDGMVGVCTYTDFVVPRTVDTKIATALKAKKNVADAVLDDPQAWREVLTP